MAKKTAVKRQPRFQKLDIAALIAFFGIAVLLICASYTAEVTADETFYYTVAKRFFAGDRFLVHEWQLAQLSMVVFLLPYRLFTAVAGGTAGIVLFMRHFYIALDLLFFLWFYKKLRHRGAPGLIAAALICADLYGGFIALDYYNICMQGYMAVCVMLFAQDRPLKPREMILTGAILAVAVLSEPQTALIYLVFTLLVAVRTVGKKRGKELFRRFGFALDGRLWFYLTVGVAAVAAVYLGFLAVTSGVGNIAHVFHELFTDNEFTLYWYGNQMNIHKIPWLIDAFGIAAVVFALLTVAAAAAAGVLVRRGRAPAALKTAVFFASLLSAIFCLVMAVKNGFYTTFSSIEFPIVCYALSCYLLCERKDRRIFAFWIVGLCCSALIDYFSDITFMIGGRLAVLPAAEFTKQLFGELGLRRAAGPAETQKPAKKKKTEKAPTEKRKVSAAIPARILSAAAVALFCGYLIFIQSGYMFFLTRYHARVGLPTVTIQAGPLKGLRDNNGFAEEYYRVLEDLNTLNGFSGELYVPGMHPYVYLYTHLREGTYSAYFVEVDKKERLQRYWELLPDKRPEFVYIPYHRFDFRSIGELEEPYFEDNVEFIKSLGETRIAEGKAGYIIQMISWY
ncbi:MAG: hypothetical protein IJL26_00315 [Clostridia bacterium]|nr:hypothetical protein [Clostridia bacterium]